MFAYGGWVMMRSTELSSCLERLRTSPISTDCIELFSALKFNLSFEMSMAFWFMSYPIALRFRRIGCIIVLSTLNSLSKYLQCKILNLFWFIP